MRSAFSAVAELLVLHLCNKNGRFIGCCRCCCGRQKADEQKAEIERLEVILDGKVEAEKKNIGN